MKRLRSNRLLSLGATLCAAFAATMITGLAVAYADAVSDAKAAVKLYSGPQTKWEGPTAAPKPDKGKKGGKDKGGKGGTGFRGENKS